jgi:hypothetical protein
VTPSLDTDDRAQLLLVGAVVLALIILGLTTVTNTVLFTENTGPGEATAETNTVEQFDYEGTISAKSIILRVNHAERNVTTSDVNATVNGEMSAYSAALARSYASGGSAFVSVNYTGIERNATRIVQAVDRNFTYNASHSGSVTDDAADWTPLPDGERTGIGWFALNVNLANTSGAPATITIQNATGDRLEYTLNRSGGGSGSNLTIQVEQPSSGLSEETSCGSTGGRVSVLLHRGVGALGDCEFPSVSTIEPPYSVSISDGDRIAGQYEIVANRTWHSNDARLDASVSGSDEPYPNCADAGIQPPCLSPVVWTGNVTLQYVSPSVEFSANKTIAVYD